MVNSFLKRVKKLESMAAPKDEKHFVLTGPSDSDFSKLEKQILDEHTGHDVNFIHILLFGVGASVEPYVSSIF